MQPFDLWKGSLLLVSLLLSYPSRSNQQMDNGGKYIGCFFDDFGERRTLPHFECIEGAIPECPQCSASTEPGRGVGCKNPDMTVDLCLEICKDFAFAGLQAGKECYCGNDDAMYDGLGVPMGDLCTDLCGGNPSQKCGGGFLNSVYDLRTSCQIENVDPNIIPSEAVEIGMEPVVFQVGHELGFSCQTGYSLSGSRTITCGSSGLFEPAVPTCSLTDPGAGTGNGATCPRPESPTFGSILPQQETFQEQQTATVRCQSGYIIPRGVEATLTCVATGWSPETVPMCVVPDCGPVPIVNNTNGGLTPRTDGRSVYIYFCEGSTPSSWTIMCDAESLTWIGEMFTCTAADGTNGGSDNGGQDTGTGGGNEPESPGPDNLPVENGDTGGLLRGLSSLLWIIAIIVVVGITIMLIGCIIAHSVSQDTASRKRPKDNTMLVVPASESQPPSDNNHFGVTDDRNGVERNAV